MKPLFFILIIIAMTTASCNNDTPRPGNTKKDTSTQSYSAGTFGYDLDFLKKHDSIITLKSDNENSQVLVSAKYQGKVFTSTADGLNGKSFGWINYKAFDA